MTAAGSSPPNTQPRRSASETMRGDVGFARTVAGRGHLHRVEGPIRTQVKHDGCGLFRCIEHDVHANTLTAPGKCLDEVVTPRVPGGDRVRHRRECLGATALDACRASDDATALVGERRDGLIVAIASIRVLLDTRQAEGVTEGSDERKRAPAPRTATAMSTPHVNTGRTAREEARGARRLSSKTFGVELEQVPGAELALLTRASTSGSRRGK